MKAWMKWAGLIWGIGIWNGGCHRPPATPTSTAETPRRLAPSHSLIRITLFFPDTDYAYLVPETRRVPTDQATPQGVLEFLAQGPREKDREAILPNPLQVQDVTVSGGTATVSLPAPFERDVGAANTALLAIQSIVYTLTERDDVQQVQFLIGGRRLTSFAGALDLSEPQMRDETLIQG